MKGPAIPAARYTLPELLELMARLRAPQGGCPWDREQTHRTLRSYLLEETYELLEAIEAGDPRAHREELGDLLLQIVFQCQVAAELGWFDFHDVADTIAQKLVRRHPHVFGEEKVTSAAEVTTAWERIKAEEKKDPAAAPRSVLDGVPKALPALLRTHRLSERAARVGFDWDNPRQVIAKLREELDELEEVLDEDPAIRSREHLAWELGDVLLAIANLTRHLGECGEDLLREANLRFENRFRLVERLARERDIKLADSSIEILEALWQEAKKILASKNP